MSEDIRLEAGVDFASSHHWSLQQAGKRLFDVSAAFVALVVLAPVMLAVIGLIKVVDPGPALFQQMRVGRNGRRFYCLKFRSMVIKSEEVLREHLERHPAARREWEDLHKLTVDPRITPLGRFLRRTSFDELPQLLNVIAGDMSLVGPRPIVVEELPRYGDKLGYYLSVRPGLTGLWQVSGRSDCTYPERVALDARYVTEWGLANDIRILLRTIPAVLGQRGSC